MGQPDRGVLIVDDHRSFAEALAIAIDAQDGLRCVAVAATAAGGLAAAVRTEPAFAIVDLQLPDAPGSVLAGQLHEFRPRPSVLALTAYADAASVLAASQAGVSAFLPKTCSIRDIVETLKSVRAGAMTIAPEVLAASSWGTHAGPALGDVATGVHLTPRERQVLVLLAGASDVRGIARELGISVHTVRDHVKSLLSKFGVHTQLELVVRAQRLGIVGEPAAPPEPEATPSWGVDDVRDLPTRLFSQDAAMVAGLAPA
jgi:DNA-binding NarL/FixJ family response regulator